MGLIHNDGLTCFQFPALAALPGFFHGVILGRTTNGQGGRVHFNLGLGHGPQAETLENRERMLRFFGPDLTGVYARQVHGVDVGMFVQSTGPIGLDSVHPVRIEGDALVTDMAAAALVVQVADCQPVILMDPAKGLVANIHSGWRGSIQNIIGATIDRMAAECQCRPEDLVCGIGPSLGPCCAEFINYKQEIPSRFWEYRRPDNLFDFWQMSIDQLGDAGVRNENIHLAGMCTKCNQHLFFSYRGAKDTGRFASVVGIRAAKGSDT